MQSVESFIEEIRAAKEKCFPGSDIRYTIRTPKSLKANIPIGHGLFIAIRYNARNGRTDIAVVHMDKRIFGYDNLKQWHFHPVNDPNCHVPCDEPSIDEVFLKMKDVFESLSMAEKLHE